jgi:hypothetical protein
VLIGIHAGSSLRRIRDSRSRPDQDESPHPCWSREGVLQRDTAPHRVPPEYKPPGHKPIEVRENCLKCDRRGTGGGPVSTEVGRERAVAFAQRSRGAVPAAPGMGKAVKEDERRRH